MDNPFKGNPVVGQLMKHGEERLAKLAAQLLSNERFVQGVQLAVQRALSAKGLLDKNVKLMLSAMNLPSTADIRHLNDRIDDLERLLGDLEDQLAQVLEPRGKEHRERQGEKASGKKPAANG